MPRLLIATGLLLMAVGFGTAGWKYVRHPSPRAVAELPPPPPGMPRQGWLISPSGGLVPQDEALAYLRQDRFMPARTVTILRDARLAELLVQGEKLPDAPYLQVLADIRAPMLAGMLCKEMTTTLAADCAVNRARVEAGSVDPLQGTARFRIELVFRLKPEAEELPDLGTHVLTGARQTLDLDAGAEGTESPEAALAAALAQAQAACPEDALFCRIQRLAVDWSEEAPVSLTAEVAWLAPLPKGVIALPPLEVAPGG